jgi:Spy/CpxP family protein refolding chaperone
MRTLKAILTAAALTLAAAGTSAAQPPEGGQEMMPDPGWEPGMVLRFLERLDLTDAQWLEIETIMQDTRETVEALRAEYRSDEPVRDFLTTFASPDLVAADLEALASRMDEMRDAVRSAGIDAMVRIHEVLTDTQLERIAGFAEMDLPFGGGRGMGGEGGFGGHAGGMGGMSGCPGHGGPMQRP